MPDYVPTTVPAACAADAAELAALRHQERRHTVTRAAIGGAFLLIGAALTGPVLLAIPPHLVAAAVLVALAAAGAVRLAEDAAAWLRARYELAPGRGRRWPVVRRWYAPGALVWYADADAVTGPVPLAVLDWTHDPACHQPWALVHNGTAPDPATGTWGAVWAPLDELTPHPPEPIPTDPTPVPDAAGLGLTA
ncbi:hypothetical protein [Actinomadura napierensis]|uniref:Uncharacterized protein n=1 Tax=Actinomadura napierensis TaxID=267854 RepID=A0ABN3AFW5_9ACTN